MANGQQISFLLAFVALAMILSAGEANVRRELEVQLPGSVAPSDANLEAQSPGDVAPSDANLEAHSPGDVVPSDANLEAHSPGDVVPSDANLEAQSPGGVAPSDANLEAQSPGGVAPSDANLEAQSPDGDTPSDAILEAFLKEMLGASERAKEKVLVVGNSQMVKECNKTYGDAIDHLNKAVALVQGGIKTPQGFAELETIVKEAMKDYEECDRVFAVATRPSPFVINDTYLKSLGFKFNSMAEADAHRT
ncbi:hypothetical protein V6N13_115473 [Hibiscus sabdariffa]|uniref:Pectinesterase inhibitor domain-containing protein n=1 Tax=Hibiscus sabdariffa TaxID=183260 RepID=A0ABR2CUA1_9ROSI